MARIRDYVEVVTTPNGATRHQVRIEAGKTDGKRQQQKRRFTKLQDAIDAYNAGRGDRSRGVQVSPSGVTLREAANGLPGRAVLVQAEHDHLLRCGAAVLRPATARLGDRPVQEIRREEFEKLAADIATKAVPSGDWRKTGRQQCRTSGPASRMGTGTSRPTPVPLPTAAPRDETTAAEVRRRRAAAAERYRPDQIRLLLVAQAPPDADDRYFYFPDVATQDSLFRSVAQAILPNCEPTRSNKASFLAQLRDRGVFLIDLKPDPVDGSPLAPYVPPLLARIAELAPERIVLIKAGVFDAVTRAGGRRPPRQQCADPVPVVGAAEGVRGRVRSGARCGVIPTSVTRG